MTSDTSFLELRISVFSTTNLKNYFTILMAGFVGVAHIFLTLLLVGSISVRIFLLTDQQVIHRKTVLTKPFCIHSSTINTLCRC